MNKVKRYEVVLGEHYYGGHYASAEIYKDGEYVEYSDYEALVENIAVYIERDSECLLPIVVEETRHDYGVRLLKVMADEIRSKFAR